MQQKKPGKGVVGGKKTEGKKRLYDRGGWRRKDRASEGAGNAWRERRWQRGMKENRKGRVVGGFQVHGRKTAVASARRIPKTSVPNTIERSIERLDM